MIEAFGYTDDTAERMTPAEALEIRTELMDRGREIVLAAPQLYIDADVEADGIAGYGSMLSIGAVSPTDPSHTFYAEMAPFSDKFIPENLRFAEEHCGLNRAELIASGQPMQEVMQEFAEWLTALQLDTGKKPVLAALKADFDFGFINWYMREAGIQNPLDKGPIDLKTLMLPLALDWDWKKTSKDRLPAWLAPQREFTHHALEDSQWQQELHFAAVGAIDVMRSGR